MHSRLKLPLGLKELTTPLATVLAVVVATNSDFPFFILFTKLEMRKLDKNDSYIWNYTTTPDQQDCILHAYTHGVLNWRVKVARCKMQDAIARKWEMENMKEGKT